MTNLFFDAGGFYAMPYYSGAIKQLYKEYTTPNSKLDRIVHYYGNSAGATFAFICFLVFNKYMTVEQVEIQLNDSLDKVNLKHKSFNLTPLYIVLLDRLIQPLPKNIARKVSGFLHVGVSTCSGHEFISDFTTKSDLYHALMCSGTIVGCSNYESKIKGVVCLDGFYCFSDNHLPADTIIISNDNYKLLILTIPPYFIRRELNRAGEMYIQQYFNNNQTSRLLQSSFVGSVLFKALVWLHEKTDKCPYNTCNTA
jgi:hypothetical protein